LQNFDLPIIHTNVGDRAFDFGIGGSGEYLNYPNS
jgi:hypothetical protein